MQDFTTPRLAPTRRHVLQGGAALVVAGRSTAAVADEAPKRGGELVFSLAAEPPTYDLHATSTFAVLQRLAPHYSTLLAYKPQAYPELGGDLAESWSVSSDQLTHSFKLR